MSTTLPSVYYGGKPPETLYKVDQVLTFHNYEIGYNYDLKMPIYAAEVITEKEAETSVGRADGFKADNRIPEKYRLTTKDYTHSGEDRGHLHSAADNDNITDRDESFMVDNVVPELHKFNAGIWEDIEAHTRKIAEDYEEVYVVTAPIFNDDKPDVNGLNVPEYVYKAVLIPEENTLGIYVAPNDTSGTYEVLSQEDFTKKYKRTPMPASTLPFNPKFYKV